MAVRLAPIEWSDDLRTGDHTIDLQHKTFFVKALRVYVATNLGRGDDEIAQMLKFMRAYAEIHFTDEESRMEASLYPHTESHKEAHRGFLAELEALQQRFAAAKEGEDKGEIARQTVATATGWFRKHIAMVDLPLIEFLQQSRQEQDA